MQTITNTAAADNAAYFAAVASAERRALHSYFACIPQVAWRLR